MTELLILFFLFILNGFFSLSEIAIVSAKKTRIEQLLEKGNRGARMVLRLQENSEDFLSAIQVGITLIGIVTGAYGGVNLAAELTPLLQQVAWLAPFAEPVSMTFAVMLITYVSIVIGELVPKTIALSHPESMACRVGTIVYYFSKALYPVVKFLAGSTSLINRLLGIKKVEDRISETELRQMIKMATNDGVLEDYENMMHEKIFYFSDKKAMHLMTHRTELDCINLKNSIQDIRSQIDASQHNKMVCFEDSLENLKGILYLKDYYRAVSQGGDFSIKKLLLKPLIVHERMDAYKVLSLMRESKSRASVVVDEYGDIQGLITLYDIMSNLVGELPAEGDDSDPDVYVRSDNSFLVSGDAPIETLGEILEGFSIDFNEIDYATVAGFVLDQTNQIPKVGDRFDFDKWTFEVVDVDGLRIDKLLITNNTAVI